MELWGFLVDGVWLSLNLQSPIAAKRASDPPKVLEVQERRPTRGPLSPCHVWYGSDFTRRRGGQNVVFFVCLFVCFSVCLSVTLLNVRDCAPDFAMDVNWSIETMLIPLDRGRFVVVHTCSTFSDCCQPAGTLNAEVEKTAKIGGFRQQRATK